MKKKKKNQIGGILKPADKNSLEEKTRRRAIIFISVTLFSLIAIVVFFIVALVTKNNVFTLLLAILSVLYIAFVAMFLFLLNKKINDSFFTNLIGKTNRNYAKLASLQKGLEHYDQSEVKEFENLNKQVDQINNFLNNVAITNAEIDYKNMELQYPDESDLRIVTLESLMSCYKQIILQTEMFRNSFIAFYYESDPENLVEQDYKRLLKNILFEFGEENILVAKDEKRGGYLLYLPYIDSLKCLEDRLKKVIKKAILTRHESDGAIVIPCKVAAVIYPYSDIQDIIPDLRYAMRQGKDINIYTPERFNRNDTSIHHSSLVYNNNAKMFEALASYKINMDDLPTAQKTVEKSLIKLGTSIGYETIGMATYNKGKRCYEIIFEHTNEKESPVFKDEGFMDRALIELLVKHADADSSYSFSNRIQVTPDIGKKFDIFGIKCGYFFLVRANNIVTSVIYFANKNKETMRLNAYDRESLITFSSYVGDFARQVENDSNVLSAQRRYRSILRLTDYNLYTIDRSNHDLLELSDGLIDALGNFKPGDKCYKKLYNLNAPCPDCPLLGKKKESMIKKRAYTTSMMLARKKDEYPTLLLSPKDTGPDAMTINRYDPQLLIHSTYGLMERLDNIFLSKNRGYVLFVSVDNWEELLEKYGEEGFQTRLRAFFRNYRHNHEIGNGEVYVYRHNIFAFVFPEEGRMDVLNRSENIYEIAQRKYDEKDPDEIPLVCTYIGVEYPQTFNNKNEFTRYLDNYITDNPSKFGRDLFILPDSNYIRMASREQFIVSLLENALQTNSLSMKYLPEIKGDKENIIGAEILLRLTDESRNVNLSPYEFIPYASKNNLIGSITNYLINRIGEMYQKYGLSAFKIAGLRSISLNVDTTFFEDNEFLSKIDELIVSFHFPKGFLHFEFNERDIAKNIDNFRNLFERITKMGIILVADNYTGKYISIDKLKELGFTNLKLSRNLIIDLEKDPTKIAGVKSIVDAIEEHGLNYYFVGVESKLQYQMLAEINEDLMGEGYYFYEPLDLDVLLDKLRQNINQ